MHVKQEPKPGALGSAIADSLRVENGKSVEHRDVMQAMPEKMAHASANANTTFRAGTSVTPQVRRAAYCPKVKPAPR